MGNSTGKWLGVGSLVVAVLALGVAIQANLLSREANEIASRAVESSITVNKPSGSSKQILARICYDAEIERYVVGRKIYTSFDILNNGGLSTSLMNIEIYEPPEKFMLDILRDVNEEAGYYEGVVLPLDVPPGSGRSLRLIGEYDHQFDNKEDAIRASRWPWEESERATIVWSLEFSDGSVFSETEEDYKYFYLSPVNSDNTISICK